MWRKILKFLALVVSDIFQKDHFVTVKSVTAAVAVASTPDDVIYCEDVENFGHPVVNL